MSLELNKYLRELGYTEDSFPFEEHNKDSRYKKDKDGFRPSEFFNLDHSMTLFLYSYLSYYREYIADMVTPGCFTLCRDKDGKENGHEKWLKLIDKILFGLKLELSDENRQRSLLKIDKSGLELEKIVTKKAKKSRELLIKYWYCFWY